MNPARRSQYPGILPLHNARTPPPLRTPNIQHSRTHLLPTRLSRELPRPILLTPAALYPKKNENAALPTSSACIVLIQITQFKIVHVFKIPPKGATANNVLTSTPCPPLLTPPLPSFPLRENPCLRAPSDRITEEHYLGYFVNFVA